MRSAWRLAALFAAMLEGQTHGVGMRHIALQRLEDGRLQIGGAVAVQQSGQGGSDGAQIPDTSSDGLVPISALRAACDRTLALATSTLWPARLTGR